jgi:hypothetical protein
LPSLATCALWALCKPGNIGEECGRHCCNTSEGIGTHTFFTPCMGQWLSGECWIPSPSGLSQHSCSHCPVSRACVLPVQPGVTGKYFFNFNKTPNGSLYPQFEN